MGESQSTFRIRIIGLVQGVGFRPFVYRIALQNNLLGTVDNRNDGVIIEINSTKILCDSFIEQIANQAPQASDIDRVEVKEIPFKSFTNFKIIKSDNNEIKDEITEVSPDIAVCDDCIADVKSQKHRINYLLTNCTHCGPRFTIIKQLPYDRPNTTMADFKLCEICHQEYTNVMDRRFHAQPVACNSCGPIYKLYSKGSIETNVESIILKMATIIDNGGVVAVKGVGGYHIVCSALQSEAVNRIRDIKQRDAKPMAVMYSNEESLLKYAYANDYQLELLNSWRRPIVLLKAKYKFHNSVSSDFSTVGSVLPYMPLHYLLFEKCKTDAIVLTSANIAGAPIIIDDNIAVSFFEDKVNAVITYSREIHNRVDDSVAFMVNNTPRLIRRSRGYAPSPIRVNFDVDGILAVGAELVNTFCLGRKKQAIPSQHIGDLKNAETLEFYQESIERYSMLFKFKPKVIACDLHPDYMSSKYAAQQNIELVKVQHHHAHMASCMLENNISDNVIGLILDGTGLGNDDNIWGGEFFYGDYSDFERIAHFNYIPLPGGDMVTKEPWRTAVSYLYNLYGKDLLDLDIPLIHEIGKEKISFIISMIDKGINSPLSSSAGRLFDAVAALTGICMKSTFHAEAPMRLQDNISEESVSESYSYKIEKSIISFDVMIEEIVSDLCNKVESGLISHKFHNTIIDVCINMCQKISLTKGCNKVVLSGGVFQNDFLSSKLETQLTNKGFEVYAHNKVPANDAGISLGQIAIAAHKLRN